MTRLETETIEKPDETGTFKTTIGILADKPGAGKSTTTIALIADRPVISNDPFYVTNASYYAQRLFETHTFRFLGGVLDTNIVLVPRTTIRQWERYAMDIVGMDRSEVGVFSSPNFDKQDAELVDSGRWKVVVMTEKPYALFLRYRKTNVQFQRLFIDEADSIHVPNFRFVNAKFTWFVTATPDHLVRGASKTCAIRCMFDCRYRLNMHVNIMVRSNDDFVEESLRLPPYSERVVQSRASSLVSALRTFVSPEVMLALDACDVHGAITRLGCPTSDNEDGLISALTSRMTREAESLTASISSAPVGAVALILNKIREIQSRMQHIVERVQQADCCPISLDEIEVKAVTPCCQNSFEFANLMRALQRANRCPMCKSVLPSSSVVVQHRLAGANGVANGVDDDDALQRLSKPELLVRELRAALDVAGTRILIFSDYNFDTYLRNVNQMLQDGGFAGGARVLKGHIDKALRDFRDGSVRVLLVNATHFGAGLNLECATHIFTMHKMKADKYQQLIGRAQRPGRVVGLQVVNFVYADE